MSSTTFLLMIALSLFVCQNLHAADITCPVEGDLSDTKALILTQAELNQSQALLSIHQPWENFFVAAPAAISLLGQLTILGGQKDFRLDDRPPQGGFKYLRNPQSFRATMAQVSNDGWNCFSVAHRNMDSIQLNMLMIPRRVQTVVKVIQKSPSSMFQRMIKVPLDGIKEISQLCVTLSRDTENEFKKIYNMLGEIVEATQNTRGVYDEKQQQSVKELNASIVQRQMLEQRQEMYRKNQEDINRKVTEYEQRYQKALADIPTGWKRVGMILVTAIGKAFANVLNAVPQMVGDVTSRLRNEPSATSNNGGTTAQKSQFDEVSGQSMLSEQARFLSAQLEDLRSGLAKNITSLDDISAALGVMDTLMPHLTDSPAFDGFNEVVNDVKTLVQRLDDLTSGLDREELKSSKDAIFKEIKTYKSRLTPLINSKTRGGPAPPRVPGQSGSGIGSNEMAQADSQAQLMRYHQDRADKNFADLMKNHEMLGALMVRMTQLNLDKIEFDEILIIIRESLKILEQIQVQWSMLTQFFMAMAVRTEIAVNQTVKPFVQTVEEGALSGPLTEDGREFLLEILQPLIRDIQMSAHFLHALSKTYVEVSSKYILNQLAGMTGLSVLPPEQRQGKMAELTNTSKTAEQEIFQMAKEKRLGYSNQINLLAQVEC